MSRFEERPTTCVLFYLLERRRRERAAAETKAGRSPRDKIVCEDFVCESLFSVERSVKRVKSDVCEVCAARVGALYLLAWERFGYLGCIVWEEKHSRISTLSVLAPSLVVMQLYSPHPLLFLLVLPSRDILLEHILPLPLHRPLDDILCRIDLLCRTKWIAWCLNLAELRREVRRYRRCGSG